MGQKIELTKNNLTADLSRRIFLVWSAFGRIQDVFKSEIPNTIKARVFDQYVLPVLTYGIEPWALNKNYINRLQVTQRAMERRILNINLQDRINNTEIRKITKVKDRKNMCNKVELGGTYWENDIQQMDANDNRIETMGEQKKWR